jgi:hypothetical protein
MNLPCRYSRYISCCMSCEYYNNLMVSLQSQISNVSEFKLDPLLCGQELFGINASKACFDAVHQYIVPLLRFIR